MDKKISILYITYNRLSYTKETLPALVENAGVDFNLTIVDNGSTDGTVDYLKKFISNNRKIVSSVHFYDRNLGISQPTNEFWRECRSEFLGKVDNDTLCPQGWLARLLEAHMQSKQIGVVGGFHFHPEYVDMAGLEQRVTTIDGVDLVPDAFIGGCCYLFRRKVQRAQGFLKVGSRLTHGWTEYQEGIFLKQGLVNGYIWPLLFVEHFDDPLSDHNLSITENLETSIISMREKGILPDLDSQLEWYKRDAARVVSGISILRILKNRCVM